MELPSSALELLAVVPDINNIFPDFIPLLEMGLEG
tara:strand:- start:92 stop:196 length:105 start_codon:yes stop_codon:yes gene_type:complete